MTVVSQYESPEHALRREWQAHTRLQAKNLAYLQSCLASQASEIIGSVELGDTESVRKARVDFAALAADVNDWMHKATANALALAQIPREEAD